MRFIYKINGMTCEHCEHRVAREAEDIAEVMSVTADAVAGSLVIVSEAPIGRERVREAVEEAGYELADG